MSILFFSDLHLGLKSYSIQDKNGDYSSEIDALNAMEAIYQRSCQEDISMIIFGGDMTHSPLPTTKNIKYLINWLNKIECLNKPFYIICGNHDVSFYSNSMIFIKELGFNNIHLIDNYDPNFIVPFGKCSIKFVPYIMNLSMKDKDVIAHSNIIECIESAADNTIIVSHIQETSCQIGSEAVMISKGVDTFNADINKNLILLLGHIHRSQVYKKGSTTICYAGSTTYNDAGDLNQDKGYYIVDMEGNINFERIIGIRLFKKYEIEENQDTLEFFSNKRMLQNHVGFITHYDDVDIVKLTEIFKANNSTIGWIKKQKEIKLLDSVEVNVNTSDIYTMFKDYVTKKFELSTEYKQDYKDIVISTGINFMNNFVGKKDE